VDDDDAAGFTRGKNSLAIEAGEINCSWGASTFRKAGHDRFLVMAFPFLRTQNGTGPFTDPNPSLRGKTADRLAIERRLQHIEYKPFLESVRRVV
jgi:hypothetical protein